MHIKPYIFSILHAPSPFYLACLACLSSHANDPLSEAELAKEELFFKKLEQKHTNGDKKKPLEKPAKSEPGKTQQVVKTTQVAPPHPRQAATSKPPVISITPVELVLTQNAVQESLRRGWLYGGVSVGTTHMYTTSNLYSMPHRSKGTSRVELALIYYGSYAYNRNSWLVDGAVFLGYDFMVLRRFRLGVEVRGGFGKGESEISSNGVFAEVGKDPIAKGYPPTFHEINGVEVSESNFGYCRQTIGRPYYVSLSPRLGFVLLGNAVLYVFGEMRYGLTRIVDHPETIEVIGSPNIKEWKDTIYNKSSMIPSGGCGIEAPVFSNMFMRFECSYSPQKTDVDLGKDVLQDTNNQDNKNRQLESLGITSINCFSFSVSAGIRF
ncbi:MAG: hypothetical protein LBF72_01560 [Holosporales bacterium]|jgi:hypothetical protein|nr:hypothetical protein [Holosporales bacterium]